MTHSLHAHSGSVTTSGKTIHWAGRYDHVVRLMMLGRDKSLRTKTAQLARIQPGDRVLDVGCGTGDLTLAAKALAGPTGQVVGIDAAPEMIEVATAKAARAHSPIDFRVEAIEKLSFADNSFDVVLSSLMMHHLPGDLKRQGLAEIRRVLKPGGRLTIVDVSEAGSFFDRLIFNHLMGHMHIGFQNLPTLAKDAGLTGIETGTLKVGVIGYVSAQKP